MKKHRQFLQLDGPVQLLLPNQERELNNEFLWKIIGQSRNIICFSTDILYTIKHDETIYFSQNLRFCDTISSLLSQSFWVRILWVRNTKKNSVQRSSAHNSEPFSIISTPRRIKRSPWINSQKYFQFRSCQAFSSRISILRLGKYYALISGIPNWWGKSQFMVFRDLRNLLCFFFFLSFWIYMINFLKLIITRLFPASKNGL